MATKSKRRKRGGSLGHITRREIDMLETELNLVAHTEAGYREKGDKVRAERERLRRDGIMSGGMAVGINCICFPVKKENHLTQCTCGKTWDAAERRGEAKVAVYKKIAILEKERIRRVLKGRN